MTEDTVILSAIGQRCGPKMIGLRTRTGAPDGFGKSPFFGTKVFIPVIPNSFPFTDSRSAAIAW